MKLVNKIIIIFILFIASINIFGIDKIILSFFYLVNGSKLQLDNNYTVNLPFAHWAYYNENNYSYYLIGRKIDSSNLTAEFYKNAQSINLTKLKKLCKIQTRFKDGIILICHKKTGKDDIIFQSINKKVLMQGNDINSSNVKVMNEYILLLKSIYSKFKIWKTEN